MSLTEDAIARYRKVLMKELEALASDGEATAADRDTVTLDQQSVGRLSRMDALQRQAMAQAAERRRGARGIRIAAALKRMDLEEFGYCQDCGDEIGTKRLDLDPTIPTCVTCARG